MNKQNRMLFAQCYRPMSFIDIPYRKSMEYREFLINTYPGFIDIYPLLFRIVSCIERDRGNVASSYYRLFKKALNNG